MTVTFPDYKPAGEKVYITLISYTKCDKALMDKACKVKFRFTTCRLDFGNLTTYTLSIYVKILYSSALRVIFHTRRVDSMLLTYT